MTDAEEREDVIVDRMAAADAFDLVADETRLSILKALAAADEPLAFSRLRERAAVADSGRFNYHLDKLTGRFVTKGEDGYELGVAGLRVVGAVLSGGYTQTFDGDSFETDAPCPRCETAMTAEFDGDRTVIGCPDCELDFYRAPIPPGAVAGRDPTQLPELVDRYQKRRAWSSALGFCPFCDGPETVTVYTEGGGTVEDDERADVGAVEDRPTEDRNAEDSGNSSDDGTASLDDVLLFRTTCERCGAEMSSVVAAAALTVPAVQGFHAEHGIDLRQTPLWELPWLDAGRATIVSERPLEMCVPVTLGDDRLDVILDGDLGVVETRRSD